MYYKHCRHHPNLKISSATQNGNFFIIYWQYNIYIKRVMSSINLSITGYLIIAILLLFIKILFFLEISGQLLLSMTTSHILGVR